MKALGYATATIVLAAPLLLASAPADARTARQEHLQGQGIYTTSKGLPQNHGGGYYRRAPGYYGGGYGYGYGYRGYPHHRRYYDGY